MGVSKFFRALFKPFGDNAAFMIFMYVLGIVCTYATAPNNPRSHVYNIAPYELFFDLYVICIILCLIPHKVRVWVRRVFYVIAYITALADLYCFVKLGATIDPTLLLLVIETNTREVTEFFTSYLSAKVIFSRMGLVLLVMLFHTAWALFFRKRLRKALLPSSEILKVTGTSNLNYENTKSWLGGLITILFICCAITCRNNKKALIRLASYDNIGDVEYELTKKDKANLYQPIYRLAFSIYANSLAAKQVRKLVRNIDKAVVDSCSFRSQNIVLIIGESFNRHHAWLYGYDKNTTPRQQERFLKGELTTFSDVIAPWNLTNLVFKLMFSTFAVGDKGEWCDYPLFPILFRKAGYHVTFITNQFLTKSKDEGHGFIGGFFLNNATLSDAMFDSRNDTLHRFDEYLLDDFDKLKYQQGENNLIIFHLLGQHVDYSMRFPKERQIFSPDSYSRPLLSQSELQVLADYDNAILYNDSVVDAIINRFEDEDAIVIYVPDHGEECFDEDVHFYGRMHTTEITTHLAHEEFDIPFWIWCSHEYMVRHPDIFKDIVTVKDRRYMTDALPHLLLYLAGISTPYYRSDLNILSRDYNGKRSRIIKDTADYDKVMEDNTAAKESQLSQ
ncbi:MAG: phosphoethanolamine transferase [Prevotella sp.]|nr:phosphoethanolamine transferase [Prevotella sp.]